MQMESLTIGQRIKGPSGSLYEVVGFTGSIFGHNAKAILVTEDARTVNYVAGGNINEPAGDRYTGRIEVDEIALDKFSCDTRVHDTRDTRKDSDQ